MPAQWGSEAKYRAHTENLAFGGGNGNERKKQEGGKEARYRWRETKNERTGEIRLTESGIGLYGGSSQGQS